MFENLHGINPMGLSASLANYKKNFINMKISTQKNYKGFTQWAFVALGLNLLFTTETIIKT